MSFGGTPSPPPMIVPPAPAPPQPLTPVTSKPPRKATTPSFLSEALAPTGQQTGARSLIGGGAT